MKIEVLDHGFVRLVSYMQPALAHQPESYPGDLPPHSKFTGWTGDLEIIRNARVSYDADWRTGENEYNDERLMKRIVHHRHTTPLEAMVMTFEVKAPLFVLRQWHRHRTWTYNEVSARYTALGEDMYVPQLDQIREQSKSSKQGRGDELPAGTSRSLQSAIEKFSSNSYLLYQELLNQGLARELARLVLPLNIYTRMFATVDLHNLFHFLELRLDEHAQYEIRQYAEALLSLVTSVCPVAVKEFLDRPRTLTPDEIKAVLESLEEDFEVNADDGLYYKHLESAIKKLNPRVKIP